MAEEAMERAIAHFDFVLSLEQELDDRFLLAIVYFWKGRCCGGEASRPKLLIYTVKGKDAALALGHPRMGGGDAGARRVAFFSAGQWKEAVRISQAAERVLAATTIM